MDATRPWGGPGHTRPPAPRWLPACPGAPKATQPLALAFPPSRFPVSPPRFFFQDLFFAFTFLIHLECVWLHLSGVQFSFLPDGRSLVPTPVLSQPALFPPSRTPTFVVYYVLVCVGIYFWILCCFPLSVPLPEPR